MTELHTSRLLLRPCHPDDAPCYALGIGELEVTRWLPSVPWPYTLSMAAEWLRQAPLPGPGGSAFIIERPGKGLIGCITLASELGYWIARPHWGRGYVTEAATALIGWHFAHGNAGRITSAAMHDNAASLRVQAKLGFVETGRELRFSQALQHNVELVLTSLSRADWLAREAVECA